MKKLLIALFSALMLAGCSPKDEATQSYEIDPVATANAPWEVDQVISSTMYCFEKLTTIGFCDRKFLGITTQGLALIQEVHRTGEKANEPYLVNDALLLWSDPDFKVYGSYTAFNSDGKKVLEGSYSNEGHREGLWQEWHESGMQVSVVNYKDGQLHGLSTIWHRNGQKYEEGYYQNDLKHGLWTYWHDNGQKGGEGNFQNDQEIGVWHLWGKEGNLIEEIDFGTP